MNAAGDMDVLDYAAELLGVSRGVLGHWIWGALLAIVALSILHLITMLATRWGDRHSTGKALIFSVLAHLALFGGWVATAPPGPQSVADHDEPPVIRTIIDESSEPIELRDPGDAPVWEKLPEPLPPEVARSDPFPAELAPAETPERPAAEPQPLEAYSPDLSTVPEPVSEMPETLQPAEPLELARSAVPLDVPDPQAVERERAEAPPALKTRMELVRPEQIAEPLVREPTRGAVDLPAPELAPPREIASLESTVDPGEFLKRDQPADTIRTRSGPAPSEAPDAATGTTATQLSEGTLGSSPVRTGPTRRPARAAAALPEGSIERARPAVVPRAPGPSVDRDVAVLDRSPAVPTPIPDLVRSGSPAGSVRRAESRPSVYQPRELSGRREAALQAGGTTATEQAVENGLRWLALHQARDGYWDADAFEAGQVRTDSEGVDRLNAGKHADSGVTGLAVLAFLGAGYTHRDGQYADNVERALGWLVRNQRSDGFLAAGATHYEQMYCHGIATYALAEAYGMENDSRLRDPLKRAVAYIVSQQNTRDGGWRYVKGQSSDMSMFGWQLMALMRADLAGQERNAPEIAIPDASRQLMIQFLKDRSLGTRRGLAGYRENEPPTPSMTAEAFFCKQMLGIARTNPSSLEAVEYLLQHAPRLADFNLYYWYYATMAMRHHGGEPWEKWNAAIQDVLVAEQKSTGDEAGSWDPRGPWGPYGGRVYSTALATMCLEVYYRSAPESGQDRSGQ